MLVVEVVAALFSPIEKSRNCDEENCEDGNACKRVTRNQNHACEVKFVFPIALILRNYEGCQAEASMTDENAGVKDGDLLFLFEVLISLYQYFASFVVGLKFYEGS